MVGTGCNVLVGVNDGMGTGVNVCVLVGTVLVSVGVWAGLHADTAVRMMAVTANRCIQVFMIPLI